MIVEQVLKPAMYPVSTPLNVAAFQCPEPIPYAEAVQQSYQPVEVGWRWGPAWSTAWFRITGRVPAELAGRAVALRFSSATEALLWDDGTPRHGLDVNHDVAPLHDPAQGNEPLDLFVEAACNHPLGSTAFEWQEQEFNQRWKEAQPGRLEYCELVALDPAVWRLRHTFEFARQLMLRFGDEAERGQQLCQALRAAARTIDAADVSGTAAAALETIEQALAGSGVATPARCFAVGHAHIDTAWLWPLSETRRKCLRSFATAVRLLERYPDFHFLCSQAQQYAWLEESSPELFEAVAARVQEGRWEPGGAMWVEADCNVPSGESLVRQILYGTRYWERKFGESARQRFLFLPDTFGFPASLPQIMAQAGLDTFITNKLGWNDTNEFPHVTFCWRGIDGSEVLAHCTPGRDYNSANTPAELLRSARNSTRHDRTDTGVWLQPFGYGDGGGGPTDWMILNAHLARDCTGLPRTIISRTDTFCDALQKQRAVLREENRDLPVWDGPLYLEYHRGTYTTQAWLKQANRRAEQALRTAEWLTFAGPMALEPEPAEHAMTRLGEAWRLVLLNQFHDILPGSSIGPVYAEARAQHERVARICSELIEAGIRNWSQQVDTADMREPMIVFNPRATMQSDVVECDGRLHWAEDVPALGVAVVDRAQPTRVHAASVEGTTLSNGLIAATIDDAGRVTRLRHLGLKREACARRPDESRTPLNQLVLYDDRPRSWEAWNIDAEYAEQAHPADKAGGQPRVVESGPLRAVLELSRPLGQSSHITQRFVLTAEAPRLDIQTRVVWNEERRLLRALFPVDVRARWATYEIQFGHLECPTHRNTPWDQASFELCAQRWMDLSEHGFGVALLNDCKYGHSCVDNVLGLSLLRSPKSPDPEADMGVHEFTYSIMPHAGDWRAAGVARQAAALNLPMLARPLAPGQRGLLRNSWAPFALHVEGAIGVMIPALKRAEGDNRLIVRLVETHGGQGRIALAWNLPVAKVECVDLLECPVKLPDFAHKASAERTVLTLHPFQIVTLAAHLS
ncbi:MAG: hypothetical protein KKB50_14670 [Planctomycetes bacterium]|nr:hypothetical protein [Planctomycetota bacterium]